MTQRRLPFLLPLLLALGITACSDANPLPTDPNFGKVSADASPIAQIATRINALFPQPEERQGNEIFARVMNALATGDAGSAQAQAAALINLLGNTDLKDPKGPETTEQALNLLLDQLFDLVGLDEDLEELLLSEATVAIVEPDEEQTVGDGEEAGAFFPAGSVEETVLVIVERLDIDPCLPTAREQREGCYNFTTIPELAEGFTVPVEVGICVDVTGLSAEQIDNFHLYGFDDGDDNVKELENTGVDFLDCEDFEPLALLDAGLLTRFAYALSRGLGRLLEPQPVRAANRGLGGLTSSFTRIGWAGATALIYGPSLNPTSEFRTATSETVANSLGIATDVVTGATWSSMSTTGAGGFGDYDAIVFGDGGNLTAFTGANANTSWGSIATGPVVVTGIHAVNHICNVVSQCPQPHADQFPPSALAFVEASLEYAVSGIETGVFALLGQRYAGATTAVSVDWLSGLGAFTAIGGGPKEHHTLTDSTHFVSPHTILPLTEGELSGWFATSHNYIVAVPTGFTTIAEGHFWTERVDNPDPAGVTDDPDDASQMTHLPLIVVR